MTQTYDRVIPYEGNDPYIFISYSHKDTDRVMPVIRALTDAGYRVWYDEGIDPGSEWPESIAQHLNGSDVCIYFISENSLKSSNCKREVNFALSKEKGFLSIVLEPVQMSLGLELQIATYMSLIRYKYSSEQQFLNKLLNVDILKPCRTEMPEEEPVPPVEIPEEVSSEPVKEKTRKKKEKPVKNPSGTSKNKSRWVIIVLLVLALAVPAAKVLSGLSKGSSSVSKKSVMIGTQEVYDNSTVTVENQELTAEDMNTAASLEKVWYLTFKNCSFEAGSLQKLSALTGLYRIHLENCKGVDSLAFTEPMEKLKEVRVRFCGINDDILSTLPLREQYTEINLRGNSLTKLPDLSVCPNLSVLNVSENEIASLEPVRTCTKLQVLYARNTKITDFSVLEPMIYLERADLANNGISSLDFLKNTTILKEIDLSGNTEIQDLSILKQNSATLERVSLEYLSKADLSPLQSCRNLTYLDITGCRQKDISYVSVMNDLETLQAAGNSISDLSPLSGCTSLKLINLAYNVISSLKGLPASLSSNYWYLYLQHNQLESLDGLTPSENCNVLMVQGNLLKDISALNDTKVSFLVLDYTPDLDTEVLKRARDIYVTSVDLSQQVALENALGNRLSLMSEEEAVQKLRERFDISVPIFP